MPDTETMPLAQRHRLRFAQSLDLGKDRSHSLHVVRADGRGVQLQVPAGWTSLWIALSGPLEMESSWCAWRLEPGRMLLWTDGQIRASSRTPAWWLVVAAPTQRWAAWRADRPGCRTAELIPWEARCKRDLKRTVVRMARKTSGGEAGTGTLMETLVAQLSEQQRTSVQAWLAKCSGRTLQRKQQSLLRLLRVQKIVSTHPEARLDLASLARYANYSPHHLIRVYRNVFGETPAECALRLRTRLAWDMVRGTATPICEITEMLGFESQSAFCRAFKTSFGITTSQARRLHVAATAYWGEERFAPIHFSQPQAA